MFFWLFRNGFCYSRSRILGGGLINAVVALACISWPKFARLARGQVLAIKNMPFIAAARLSGSGSVKIVFKHILPNIIGPDSGNGHPGYWHHDDGTGGTVFSGIGSDAADCGMGVR